MRSIGIGIGIAALGLLGAACGGPQGAAAVEPQHCEHLPAGTVLHPEVVTVGIAMADAAASATAIQDGEYQDDGVRTWGKQFGAAAEGSVAWVVETSDAIRIGYRESSWCGGAPRPESGFAVRLPGTTKAIVAEVCDGNYSCQAGVP